MRRHFTSLLLSFSFLFLAAQGSLSQQAQCSAQFLEGVAPLVRNQRLAERSQPLCFSELGLLYSGISRTPLWSAEHLTAARVQRARHLSRPRSSAFHEEWRLQPDLRAELVDYRRSGFDRGHMSPAGDMSTPEAQEESFSLANMAPQHPCNNEVLWEGIESAVRDLAETKGELYVVTGPAFLGDKLKSLNGRVLIPTHLYKAIYAPALREAGAYFAPNDASQAWEALSVAELETRIGIDVFPALSAEIKKRAMALPEPTPHFGCRLRTSEADPLLQSAEKQ